MSLPNNSFSPSAPASLWLPPDDISRYTGLIDYELGGIALNDASQGLQVQTWRARVDGNTIKVGAEPYTTETVIVTGTTITEISLAFDQNMRPTIAYIDAGQAKLYWYDSFLGSTTTTILASDIVSLFVTMDDKRPVATLLNFNDILLFYVRSDVLYYRQQRDRYNTERMLAILTHPNANILKSGMSTGWRVQVHVVYS